MLHLYIFYFQSQHLLKCLVFSTASRVVGAIHELLLPVTRVPHSNEKH
jgi:hypothetical protein